MKTPQTLISFAAVLILGIYLGSTFNQPVSAQALTVGNPQARYQMETWNAGTSARGCYVLDTYTGKIWSIEGTSQPKKLSDQLH